jgi:hypothetical protein
MRVTAHEGIDSTDVLQVEGTDLLEDGSADIRAPVLHDAVLHISPILRGAAYLAALDGDPWRTHG